MFSIPYFRSDCFQWAVVDKMTNRRARHSPLDDATLHILACRDKDLFQERLINSTKGMLDYYYIYS